jgi:hypothetical protein
VVLIMFNGKQVAKTQPYASVKGAEAGGKKLAARYQAYWKRTGRRWDVEQDEIGANKRAKREEAKAARLRITSMAPQLLETVEDFITDHDNGLGPSIDRLRAVVTAIREG